MFITSVYCVLYHFITESTHTSELTSLYSRLDVIDSLLSIASVVCLLISGKGYVPATPIPGTIIVNIGDIMQRWTADSLIATKHRVSIPEVETKKRLSRQSMAFFVFPDDDYVIECLDDSNKYEPTTTHDYMHYRFSVTY